MGKNSEIKRESSRRNPVGLLSFMNINGKEVAKKPNANLVEK